MALINCDIIIIIIIIIIIMINQQVGLR